MTARLRTLALPRIATVLAAVGLSLAIVAGPAARPAAAFAPSPVIVQGAIRSAPVAAAACTTGVGCVAVGVVALGMLAYSTKDSWMPWLEAKINGPEASSPRADGSWGCPITIGSVSPQPTGGLSVTYNYGAACGCGSQCGPPQMTTSVSQRACISKGTHSERPVKGQVYTLGGDQSMPIQSGPNGGTPNTHTANFAPSACYADARAVAYKAVVQIYAERGASAFVNVTWEVPDDVWSQGSRVECKRPDGTTFTLNANEVGQPGRVSVPSCYASDPNSWPVDVKVFGPDGSTLLGANLNNYQSDYPNCFGPQGMTCVTRVYVGNTVCAVGVPGCANWWLNRAEAEQRGIECRFGSYVVPLIQCEPLKRSYRTDYDPNGEPATDPVANPGTDPNPEPEPTPSPTASPSPTAAPEPGSGTNPPTGDGSDSDSCMSDAFTLNPVDWVYVPVKCVLVWAFVPKTSLSARVENITNLIKTRVPFSYVAGLGGLPAVIPSGSCPDWTVTVGDFERNVVCGHGYTNAIRAARPVLTGFMLALALWPLIRSTMYAAFPILKPTPSVLR